KCGVCRAVETGSTPKSACVMSYGSRAPPRAPAGLIYRVVLLSLPTVFDRSEVCSASSFLSGSSLDLLCRTRVSCHRLHASEVRLPPSVSAYNRGSLLRRLVFPAAIRTRRSQAFNEEHTMVRLRTATSVEQAERSTKVTRDSHAAEFADAAPSIRMPDHRRRAQPCILLQRDAQ